MPKNHYGSTDPDYDAGNGNRDFNIITTQDGNNAGYGYATVADDPDRNANARENMPDEDPFLI